MTQRNRLPHGGRIDRTQPLEFRFNGRCYQGYRGDTLASALLANRIDLVGRSFKYARPRGIVAAGAEEPNAILMVGSREATLVPNVRATQQALYPGLVAATSNGWPNVENDMMALFGKLAGALMPPGFYYKTFLHSQRLWMTCEKYIRRGAGIGRAPTEPDPDHYDVLNQHCDVLVIGAGPAGLAAALSAARSGARVILADEQEEFGGSLLDCRKTLDDQPATTWVADVIEQLHTFADVVLLPRSTVTGYHDHNFLTIHERRSDHLGETSPNGSSRQRIHRVRAARVVLATGAHERPLVYGNNDLPGNMLAGAVSTYLRRYAVAPGRRLLLSVNNDHAYRAALDWLDAGLDVVAIADARPQPQGDWPELARQRGIQVIAGAAVTECAGAQNVRRARIAKLSGDGRQLADAGQWFDCDLVASSGGYSPVVHLSSHLGNRPQWRDDILGFVPSEGPQRRVCAGAVHGVFALPQVLQDGAEAGAQAARQAGFAATAISVPAVPPLREGPTRALFLVPHDKPVSRAPKQFVDMQNDVTAGGIDLAVREGFESIEHIKRYTALGLGTDQGKLGNINGLAVAAQSEGVPIPQVGTTMFRPNYTPVSFGAVVGRHCGELFEPERYTALHAWHVEHGALFEDVGQWKRPWYYPRAGEDLHAAVARECLAVRNAVGILDASTLGKIDIQGPDAREFLNRVYTNVWTSLAPGKVRYGLMCREDGMVMDDGTTACLADDHFLMTTTTGGAARVLEWLELYHQTEWPDLKVYFSSVTDHWATLTLSGPESRKLLQPLTDIDLDHEAFPFLSWKQGEVAGVPARVFRISFTGELSFEINVQADYARGVWERLFEQGRAHGITPYGTETMHVLRAEKGFVIVGQETDGTTTPYDLNMGWAVGLKKPFSWIGRRGLMRSDCTRENRKQLVGLLTCDATTLIPEGSQLLFEPQLGPSPDTAGHVSSSYPSATLGRPIALALVRDGLKRLGQRVYAPLCDGRIVAAEIVPSVFFDAKGERQNV